MYSSAQNRDMFVAPLQTWSFSVVVHLITINHLQNVISLFRGKLSKCTCNNRSCTRSEREQWAVRTIYDRGDGFSPYGRRGYTRLETRWNNTLTDFRVKKKKKKIKTVTRIDAVSFLYRRHSSIRTMWPFRMRFRCDPNARDCSVATLAHPQYRGRRAFRECVRYALAGRVPLEFRTIRCYDENATRRDRFYRSPETLASTLTSESSESFDREWIGVVPYRMVPAQWQT
jgi:hypothetical protein